MQPSCCGIQRGCTLRHASRRVWRERTAALHSRQRHCTDYHQEAVSVSAANVTEAMSACWVGLHDGDCCKDADALSEAACGGANCPACAGDIILLAECKASAMAVTHSRGRLTGKRNRTCVIKAACTTQCKQSNQRTRSRRQSDTLPRSACWKPWPAVSGSGGAKALHGSQLYVDVGSHDKVAADVALDLIWQLVRMRGELLATALACSRSQA